MMSQCRVPNWNLRHQGQEEVEEGNRPSQIHNHNQHNPSHVFPMSNYEVAELTWENGQLAMHGLGGLLSNTPTKPTWGTGRACDTLESIVHQATCTKQSLNFSQNDRTTPNISSGIAFASSRDQISGNIQKTPAKRTRSDSDHWGRSFSATMQDERAADRSACGSATATFCKDNENNNNNNNNTMMTWASFESPPSLKTKTTDEDSACHGGSENQDEDRETKGETGRSHSTRRSRAAAIHNQSERRRRDRINQKMKALQKLVPNASKTDKASMLDEVIEYLKQLQSQVHMMSSVRNMPPPQMMMPLGMQQQIQMSLLARMGMGLGMGMGMGQSLSPLVHPNAATASTFVQPPHFMVPPPTMVSQVPQPNSDTATRTSVPFNDPYCAFLAQQSMNMDLYNKMAVLYRQQVNQTSPSQSNHVQGD